MIFQLLKCLPLNFLLTKKLRLGLEIHYDLILFVLKCQRMEPKFVFKLNILFSQSKKKKKKRNTRVHVFDFRCINESILIFSHLNLKGLRLCTLILILFIHSVRRLRKWTVKTEGAIWLFWNWEGAFWKVTIRFKELF